MFLKDKLKVPAAFVLGIMFVMLAGLVHLNGVLMLSGKFRVVPVVWDDLRVPFTASYPSGANLSNLDLSKFLCSLCIFILFVIIKILQARCLCFGG